MNATPDELRVYFARVRPVYGELFGMAHAICGNYELAEYSLQRAMLEGFALNARYRGRSSFREGLRNAVKRIAFTEAMNLRSERMESTWDGFRHASLDEPADNALLELISQEPAELRRLLILRYGCSLSASRAARVLDISADEARSKLSRFEARIKRRLGGKQRIRFDSMMEDACREELKSAAAGAPDMGAAYRSFEVEVSQAKAPVKHRASKLAAGVICGVLALVCAFAFLLLAVLLVPQPIDYSEANGAPVSNVLSEDVFMP